MQAKRKKILYIITQGTWGGAQRYVYDLVNNLCEDFDITVAIGESKGKKNLQEKLEIGNWKLEIIQLKHLVRRISPIHDILAIFELRKLYKKLKPDIIHLNSSKAGIIGSLAKSAISNPSNPAGRQQSAIIYTVHGWVFNEPLSWLRKKLYLILEKFTARWKDKIIVLSKQDKNTAIERLHIDNQKLSLIPLGIKIPERLLSKDEARKKIISIENGIRDTGYGIRDTWIGTIAGLYKTKGLDILVEAVKKINFQFPISNFHFFIIGEGPEKQDLQLLITNYQLHNLRLLGSIENADKLLPAFDLFVLPSRKEGLPYTLLEAMAAKVPVVASRVGGIPSLIENRQTGILVDPENSNKLAEAIAQSLRNKDELQKFTAQTFEKAQNFSLFEMLKKTTGLYSSL